MITQVLLFDDQPIYLYVYEIKSQNLKKLGPISKQFIFLIDKLDWKVLPGKNTLAYCAHS